MALSKNVVDTLVDLIENKLAVMQIGDRDDLREVIVLQHCLTELRGLGATDPGEVRNIDDIPRRGRRRKVSAMMEDMRDELMRQRA
ncbi:MAG: hypothetical protein PHY92_07245 [Alphaproteobacteria bacterium]|nr:hypothetical protein [Alphaproteobacteria bacterium]